MLEREAFEWIAVLAACAGVVVPGLMALFSETIHGWWFKRNFKKWHLRQRILEG